MKWNGEAGRDGCRAFIRPSYFSFFSFFSVLLLLYPAPYSELGPDWPSLNRKVLVFFRRSSLVGRRVCWQYFSYGPTLGLISPKCDHADDHVISLSSMAPFDSSIDRWPEFRGLTNSTLETTNFETMAGDSRDRFFISLDNYLLLDLFFFLFSVALSGSFKLRTGLPNHWSRRFMCFFFSATPPPKKKKSFFSQSFSWIPSLSSADDNRFLSNRTVYRHSFSNHRLPGGCLRLSRAILETKDKGILEGVFEGVLEGVLEGSEDFRTQCDELEGYSWQEWRFWGILGDSYGFLGILGEFWRFKGIF